MRSAIGFFVCLALGAAIGCSSTAPRLDHAEVAALAVQLANEQAHAKWGQRPFSRDDQPGLAKTDDGWRWSGWVGRGVGDLRAEVRFDRAGNDPHVEVSSTSTLVLPPVDDLPEGTRVLIERVDRFSPLPEAPR